MKSKIGQINIFTDYSTTNYHTYTIRPMTQIISQTKLLSRLFVKIFIENQAVHSAVAPSIFQIGNLRDIFSVSFF